MPYAPTLPLSCFSHAQASPDLACLELALGEALPLWQAATDLLTSAAGTAGTWRSYGPKYGWRLDFRRGKGPFAVLYPRQGGLLFGINVLQREWPAALALALSNEVRAILASATSLPDGRYLLVPVCSQARLTDLRLLAGLKIPGNRVSGRKQ